MKKRENRRHTIAFLASVADEASDEIFASLVYLEWTARIALFKGKRKKRKKKFFVLFLNSFVKHIK